MTEDIIKLLLNQAPAILTAIGGIITALATLIAAFAALKKPKDPPQNP